MAKFVVIALLLLTQPVHALHFPRIIFLSKDAHPVLYIYLPSLLHLYTSRSFPTSSPSSCSAISIRFSVSQYNQLHSPFPCTALSPVTPVSLQFQPSWHVSVQPAGQCLSGWIYSFPGYTRREAGRILLHLHKWKENCGLGSNTKISR